MQKEKCRGAGRNCPFLIWQFLLVPYHLRHALNTKFKTQHCPWFYFCLRMPKSRSDYYIFWISISGFRYLEGHFRTSFKYLDIHIHKWIMSSRFSCSEWCWVSKSITYLCLLTNLDIQKVIYVVQVNFQMTKSKTSELVYETLWFDLLIWISNFFFLNL